MSNPLSFLSLASFGVAPAAALLTRGFADYFVPIALTADSLQAMARANQIDFDTSVVLLRGDEPAGIALIARRGTTTRLASMCLPPETRGRGNGRTLLNRVLDDARERADTAMVLEVINQNEPALQLYRSAGFQPVRQLLGFSAPAADVPAVLDVTEHAPASFAEAASDREQPDLPWQISAVSLAAVDPSRHTTCSVKDLRALVAILPDGRNVIRGLLPTHDADADTAALRSIRAHWPASTWQISALMPAEWSSRFTGAGFERIELSQTQMRLEL